jgi:Transposase
MILNYYAGIDVSLEESCVCAVDTTGKIVREAKVASEPETLIAWFRSLGMEVARIGLEAGPLSQWLYAGMQQAGLAVELLETRHVRNAFKIMPVKTNRKDARGIAELMRLGWFRPVHWITAGAATSGQSVSTTDLPSATDTKAWQTTLAEAVKGKGPLTPAGIYDDNPPLSEYQVVQYGEQGHGVWQAWFHAF